MPVVLVVVPALGLYLSSCRAEEPTVQATFTVTQDGRITISCDLVSNGIMDSKPTRLDGQGMELIQRTSSGTDVLDLRAELVQTEQSNWWISARIQTARRLSLEIKGMTDVVIRDGERQIVAPVILDPGEHTMVIVGKKRRMEE